jgi:hypothetical protein
MSHAAVAGWVDDVVINLKLLWFQNEWIKAVTYLSIWTLFGIVYGMYSSQNMTFLTALYFAVTSISTAGLEGLKPFAEFSDRTGLDSNISVDSADFYMAWKYQVKPEKRRIFALTCTCRPHMCGSARCISYYRLLSVLK